MKILHALSWTFVLTVAFADAQPFSRYQTIIERKPFGPEPANFDPNAVPGTASSGPAENSGEMTPEQRSAEEQQLASSVRVSILNVSPSGEVKVGFTDSSANPAENYYLKVGGSQNGWTVKSADPATESVTLEKGGVQVTVKLGESTGGKGGALKRGQNRPGFKLLGRRTPDSNVPESPARPNIGGLARLRQRNMEIAEKEREAAERKREADAAAKAEKAEREAREAAEKQRAEEERAQQREALLQIQEQLRKQREEREAARENRQTQGEGNEANDT